jgi:hypothetical protein
MEQSGDFNRISQTPTRARQWDLTRAGLLR